VVVVVVVVVVGGVFSLNRGRFEFLKLL